MRNKIYYEDLVQMIMEAKKTYGLQSAAGGCRKARDLILV